MKKRYLILIASILFAACTDWLDIQPALEIRKDQLFENEDGFKNVLTGAYIRMATPDLYGKNTTMTLPEFMTRHWIAASKTLGDHLGRLEHEETPCKDLEADVWLAYYQTIVNLNTLLGEIDAKRDVFTNGNYELIKGEALGLRAFLHFEVARLWGEAPARIKSDEADIPYVTYVTKNPKDLRPVSYAEFSRRLLADLDSAELLLKNDPILSCFISTLNQPGLVEGYEQYNRPEDPYHYYRQSRFNYYAVKATKARYHHWMGNSAEAARLAGEVIDALNTEDGSLKFRLGDESVARYGELTFPSEHILAVNNSRAQEVVAPLFVQYYNGYTQDSLLLERAYEVTLHPNDIRFRNNRLWQSRTLKTGFSSTYTFFKKYVANDQTAVDVIPLIRLSEMYFIAIENGDRARFARYRESRNLHNSADDEVTGANATDESVLERLEKEYRKEFYGEGQMFFFYKRHARENFSWPAVYTIDVARYKLPRPETQTLFETL
ncbi:MAG: RagB/SusD family nutrient uptake outer membrane protein [Odoribacteraceae bacterium]|jgi:hypothetical protein|nr:RagB/SusD family nutrient uptake outer membrane protein [Odoribacteraceae bacterium]